MSGRESTRQALEREVSLVVAEHQRKGIAKKMLELFLDFDQLRAEFYCSEEDEEVIFRFIFFIFIFGDRIGPSR